MIYRSSEMCDEADAYSEEDVARIIPFGVYLLDKTLLGILPTDLVLIAADSGCGKTELASTISLNAGNEGKRVLYFALEAERLEIEKRIKFKIYLDHYVRGTANPRMITFDHWLARKAQKDFEPFRQEVNKKFRTTTENLYTYYKTQADFGADDLKNVIEEYRGKFDLVIVDHLHYFDTNDPNESMALGRVVKRIRHMALSEKLPVVLICHVRKKIQGKDAPLVPAMEDIFGHSDVYKNATKVIMLAPGEPDLMAPHLFETYIHAAKYRFNGGVKFWAGKVVFNSMRNAYESRYKIGQFTNGGKQFREIVDPKQLPHWAR